MKQVGWLVGVCSLVAAAACGGTAEQGPREGAQAGDGFVLPKPRGGSGRGGADAEGDAANAAGASAVEGGATSVPGAGGAVAASAGGADDGSAGEGGTAGADDDTAGAGGSRVVD